MKASVYVSPFNRTDLVDDNVTIVAISSKPKLKKNGEMVKPRGYWATQEGARIRTLYEKGIRVANVIFSDGTQCDNVWVNIKDIRE